MSLKRTPPLKKDKQKGLSSDSKSPPRSAFTTPLQHYFSDSNVPEMGEEAGIISAASSASSLSTNASKVMKRKNSNIKRKHEETADISKLEVVEMFKELQKQQDARFDTVLKSLSELKLSMDFLSTKYDEAIQKIEVLERERKNDKSYILMLESRLEQQEHIARCTSIEIRNVPQRPSETKEDLKKMISSAAQCFNITFENNEIKDIYRVNTKAAIKPIVADFTTVSLRDNFLGEYKKYNKENQQKKFNTSNLKIDGSNKPIYLSENLTQRERKLFYLAREFSKSYGYLFCWTSFGRIFLRKTTGEPQIRIFSENDIEKLKAK